MTDRAARLWHAATVVSVTISTALFALRRPSLTLDELSLLIYPDLVGQGRVPNRDFFTPYGPGTYWPLTGVYKLLSGPSVLTERVVGLGYHVALALAVWALCRPYGRRTAVLAGCLSGVLCAGLQLVAYGWLLGLAAAVWAVALGQRRMWLASGLLAGLACTVRPEFGIVLFVVIGCLVPQRAAAVRVLTGFLVGGLPLWIHSAVAGPELIRNVFLDRLRADNRLPLSSIGFGSQLMLLLVLLAVGVLVVHGVRARSRNEAAVALLALGVLPQIAQRTEREHLLFVAVFVLPTALAVVISSLGRRLDLKGHRSWLGLVGAGGAILLIVAGVAFGFAAPQGDRVVIGQRSLYTPGPGSSAWIRSVVSSVRSQVGPRDSMFVGATDMSRPSLTSIYIYYLAPDLIPDAYYLELGPGVSEREGSGLIDDVRRADVLVLTKFTRAQARVVFPYLKPGSNRVNRYYQAHFCYVTSEHEIRIWRRCR